MLTLPRLGTNWREQPQLLERYWHLAMSQIEELLNQIVQIPIIAEGLEELSSNLSGVEALALEAKTIAETTASSSGTNFAELSLNNSYVSNFTAPLISADSSGNVTVANHDRVYGDSVLNPTVAVTGSVINTGATAGQVVRIYYEDASRSGGAVSYLFTVDPATSPPQSGDTHVVAAVSIPATGTVEGKERKQPGYIEL